MNLQQAPQTPTQWANAAPQAEPAPFGLHQAFAVTLQRIASINAMLDGTMQRIHGPRPTAASNAKNPETPSITLLAEHLGQEINRLESLASEVVKFIG